MKEQEIKAVIVLLEATLGRMAASDADKVVEGVIQLLKSKLINQ